MPHVEVYKAATSVGAEGVKTANIEASAVTPAKTLLATTPAVGAVEGEATLGTAGVARTVVIGWFSKKEAETTVKHKLGKEAVLLEVFKLAAKATPINVAITSYKAVNAEELKIKWTAEPVAKEEYLFVVVG